MPEAFTVLSTTSRLRKRIASRVVGQLLYELLLLEPLVYLHYLSTHLLPPHNSFNHSGCVAHIQPSCRNRALTIKTTSQEYDTRTSSHRRPILLNFSTFLAPALREDSTQVQAMPPDLRESNL